MYMARPGAGVPGSPGGRARGDMDTRAIHTKQKISAYHTEQQTNSRDMSLICLPASGPATTQTTSA